MLTLLISVGRFSIALASVLVIAATTVEGWFYGAALNNKFPGATAGFFVGLLVAGSVFGLAAAVFDIQRTLRAIAKSQDVAVREWEDDIVIPPRTRRTEPRI